MKLLITNQIRKYRFDNNEMTQEQLATLVDCSRQTIIAIEKGQIVPSLQLAFRIAAVFNKNLEEVFQYSGNKRFTVYERI